jgi:DNA-binding beta-propeller fold protein YncE
VARVWPLGLPVADAAAAAPVQILPELRCAPLAEYAGPYAGLSLLGPTAVAVAADGARLLADTGNHRVVVLEPDGRLRRVIGGRCELARNEGSCDGRFLEPWGIASGAAGEIVVADTWNGRVQFFDAQGQFLRTWGVLGLDQPPPIPLERLYGPRGVAFDEERRRVVVSDTGHKRVLVLDPDGRSPREAGGGGSAPGRFDEPVGIAVDPRDGSVYVADAWNGRVQKLGPDLEFQAAWPVPGWGGRDVGDKPYLAVDDRGNVYASVPAKGRVLVFGPDGIPLLSLVGSDWKGTTAARPAGVAADPAAGALLVADTAKNRVVALPLVRSAEEGCR